MNQFWGFILILFVLAALLRVDFFFTILYLFVGVYLVLRLWASRMVADLQITRNFTPRAFLGDTVTVTLTIQNTGRLPIPWLELNEAIPWSLSLSPESTWRRVISLPPLATQTFTYTLQATRRGYYHIGPLITTTGDLLGLQHTLTTRTEPDYLIVYPRIVPLSQLGLPTHSPQVILPTPVPIFEDPSRITGIRSYHWGDNPRYIHWPATAAGGSVMVKQFQPAIARETMIFLNLNQTDYHRKVRDYAVELAITTAASIAAHTISQQKLPLGLGTVALDPLQASQCNFYLTPGKEQSHLMQILEVLARVQPLDSGDFLDTLRQQAVHLSWGSTIVIITHQESPLLIEALLWLKQSGFKPSLILIGSPVKPVVVWQLAIAVFELRFEKDLETWPVTF